MPADASASATAESASARAERAVTLVEARLARAGAVAGSVDRAAKACLFLVYLVCALLNFWLVLVAAVIAVVHGALRAIMLVVLFLSGGVAPASGGRRAGFGERLRLTGRRTRRKVAAWGVGRWLEIARLGVGVRRGCRTFWHLTFERKLVTVSVVFLGVGLPAVFLVPRPHYVRVTDDNALHYTENGRLLYLVHGVDLFDANRTREYVNEDAWWLGKVNSQGLKSQLQPGRQYRFWVVGLRWYYLPRLFPNVIAAVEVDSAGRLLRRPAAAPPAVSPPSSSSFGF